MPEKKHKMITLAQAIREERERRSRGITPMPFNKMKKVPSGAEPLKENFGWKVWFFLNDKKRIIGGALGIVGQTLPPPWNIIVTTAGTTIFGAGTAHALIKGITPKVDQRTSGGKGKWIELLAQFLVALFNAFKKSKK